MRRRLEVYQRRDSLPVSLHAARARLVPLLAGTGIALAGVFAYSQMKRLMKAQSTNGSAKAA
jgi:hypothetical protein